jgi:hypothetical protein
MASVPARLATEKRADGHQQVYRRARDAIAGDLVMLRIVLLLRAAFNLLFGIGLLVWTQVATLHGLSRGGYYAVLDGLLGLALAAALLGARARGLAVLVLVDALARLLFGTLILANPGMGQTTLGTAFFFTAAIVACIALGVGGMLYALLRRRAEGLAHEERAMLWPAFTMSLLTLLLGASLAVGFIEETRRAALACYAIALGLALGYAGHRLGRPAGVAVASSSR